MTRSAASRPLAVLALVTAAPLFATGCARELPGPPPPADRPSYPTGLALHPEENLLAVVSSNFDLGFARGALLVADLDRVDAALADTPAASSLQATVTDAYVETALIPSFGNDPVFSSGGEHLFVATRADNLLLHLGVDATDGVELRCGAVAEDGETPLCGVAPQAITVPGNDPFSVELTGEAPDRVNGIAASLLSDQIVFFTLRVEDDGAGAESVRLQQSDVLTLGGWLEEEQEVVGVRDLALRQPQDGAPLTAFAVVERTADNDARLATDLIWFDATRGRRAEINVLPLTEVAGAFEARSLALTPDQDALLVVLRQPDGLARVDLEVEGGLLAPALSQVVSTCEAPVTVEIGRVPVADDVARDRAYVTCFEDDAVLGYNPLTLDLVDASRFFGRGPYDVALDLERETPRAYVSYFLDDSVGVFDLVEEGVVGLFPRGRIGTPQPKPQ